MRLCLRKLVKMIQGSRSKNLKSVSFLKIKQHSIPYTDPMAVPCARALATINVACRSVTKLMAIVSPDQYPFSLLYIKPNSTARPRESEHLIAKRPSCRSSIQYKKKKDDRSSWFVEMAFWVHKDLSNIYELFVHHPDREGSAIVSLRDLSALVSRISTKVSPKACLPVNRKHLVNVTFKQKLRQRLEKMQSHAKQSKFIFQLGTYLTVG
ncbi:Myosin-binding C, fast-type [Gossypium arboreum]|uniref:Myosin-binding C, fast-type n=1 Tax=Gossypium arboreum TaxID=29729 RepID=A0A0B0NZP2_GOSAR|nr:Myosin-binding C, fast-type [Gossypium arboreum]